jgi:RNA polymerase sigma factor (sigma-70 family)
MELQANERQISGTDPVRPELVALPFLMTPKPSSLAALFVEEESSLLRYAIGLVGRRGVAEELVQETFLRLHPMWDQVENPRGWIYRSLRNLSINHLRSRRPESELHEEIAAADASLPNDALSRTEALGWVRLLLEEMPDEDRQLVRLKYQDELKYQEISERTGLSVSNVGYRLHHLLKGLAEGLRRAGIEGSNG